MNGTFVAHYVDQTLDTSRLEYSRSPRTDDNREHPHAKHCLSRTPTGFKNASLASKRMCDVFSVCNRIPSGISMSGALVAILDMHQDEIRGFGILKRDRSRRASPAPAAAKLAYSVMKGTVVKTYSD